MQMFNVKYGNLLSVASVLWDVKWRNNQMQRQIEMNTRFLSIRHSFKGCDSVVCPSNAVDSFSTGEI